METNEIECYRQKQAGVIALNRPQALNALTMGMCIDIKLQLEEWLGDDNIKVIIIRSNDEKAFCSGGDIRAIYHNGSKHIKESQKFFQHEYQLNRMIAHYPKPYVALCHGVTMGGGVGMSIHGSHRVGAINLKWAMPETSIGFFTDVGATYFLNQLPGSIGMFLGLTGQRLNAADALFAKIIDYVVPYENFDEVIENLSEADLGTNHHEAVHRILHGMALISPTAPLPPETFVLKRNLGDINSCFSENSLAAIFESLSEKQNTFCEQILNQLAGKSPNSLQVVFTQLHDRPESETIDDALRLEYRIATRMLQTHDFYEGVRAALIDKDRQPRWEPKSLKNVENTTTSAYFEPLAEELRFENPFL